MPYDRDEARAAVTTLADQLLEALDEGNDISGLVLVARIEPGGVPLIAYEVDVQAADAPPFVLDTLVSAARAASMST